MAEVTIRAMQQVRPPGVRSIYAAGITTANAT
jgi:hypothetical protein